MGRTAGRQARPNAKGRAAAVTDRHMLYEAAVQSVDYELDFFQRVFRTRRGRTFHRLREDFCGTGLLACHWVARSPSHQAWGVDIHRPTLEWGEREHASRLGSARPRLTLLCEDVRTVRAPQTDVVVALNYSYSVFKDRSVLRDYFRKVCASLAPDGLFFLDAFGGTEATNQGSEDRKVKPSVRPDGTKVPGFTYVWEQASFNPIDHHIRCYIHFRFPDGRKMERAFRYDWRFWTLPELQEILLEAGFRSAEVYLEGWDDEADEADGIYRRRKRFEEMAGWVAYVVGLR
ncbi:MAG: cyclopropane-fatty-acyl-phospholipid synthase family protein [Candidatus Eisenbacteria bacterium]